MKSATLLAFAATVAIACSGGSDSPSGPEAPAPAAVASVTITGVPGELEIGQTVNLQGSARSAQGAALTGHTIAWTSSDNNIATVSASGALAGIGTGSVSITASTEGKSAAATIKVDSRANFLTAIVEPIRVTYDLPALAVAIVTRSGGQFGKAASGRRRMSQPNPVTNDDMWHIGSDLKAITAHVVASAVTDGKISWTTTLQEAYPELAGTMRAEYRTVTLKQLLGHIGGFAPNIENPAIPGTGSLTSQRAKIAAWVTSVPASPGVGQYNYSNIGFMVAANMVERAVGSPWEDIMQTKLLAPLGITGFGWGVAPYASNQNPIGHQRNGTSAWVEYPGSDNPPYLSAAGRSHWSIDGWSKVIQEIMKADQGQSSIVSQANARVTTTSQSSANYAAGWQTSTASWGGGRGVEHDGSNNLNYARLQIALDRGVAVLAVTNSHDIGSNRSNNAMAAATTQLWNYYNAHSAQ